MITIHRQRLLDELKTFASEGNGLIVGKPGVGKSYMCKLLQRGFVDQNIPAEIIKIDNLGVATDEAITRELDLTENWLDILSKIKITNNQKALLIFDAFDAARNEDFRNKILDKIKIALSRLSEKWNILVSVRTYDASKSQELMKLFPLSQNQIDHNYCRKVNVPELDDTEVQEAIHSLTKLSLLYQNSTRAFKDIVRIPFFLKLAEEVVIKSDPDSLDSLKVIKSETQLLNTYWELTIGKMSNQFLIEKLLVGFLQKLINAKTLSISKSDFLSYFNEESSEEIDFLLRENIVSIISTGSQRVSFSHNILFDYAISRIYLDAKPAKLLEFITEDRTRPFFLRPSFIYFFSQLWYDNRTQYWQIFEVFSNESSKELQLFLRLVIIGVVSSEFEETKDLTHILNHKEKTKRIQFTQYLLQSLRFLRNSIQDQDVDLLEILSASLELPFAFDFGFLLDRAINSPEVKGQRKESLGRSSRNFLQWALDQRKTDIGPYVNRLGAGRGVELVCKTFESDKDASKAVLSNIFKLLEEPNFEIYYLSNLSEYSKNILPFDPIFVSEIYLRIFKHRETSTQQTSMGSSVIMNLTSNRRQDYELNYFRLVKLFPVFQETSPILAIETGLEIVNFSISEDRIKPYMNKTEIAFLLNRSNCTFIPDSASLWADSINYTKPVQIGPHIINYFTQLRDAGKTEKLIECLDCYIKNAKCGYTWKILLEFALESLSTLSDYFYSFCITPVFMSYSETYYEIGELIERATPYYNNEQIKSIEKTIHALAKEKEKSDSVLSRFLSRIPADKLQLKKSIDFIERNGKRENQKPFESFTSVSDFTNEMWLEERNVDIKDSTNSELLREQKALSAFNNKWLNNAPPESEGSAIILKAFKLFQKIKSQLNVLHKDLTFTVLNDIAQTAAIVSRSISGMSVEEFQNVKEIIFFCFEYLSEYEMSDDEEQQSASRGYSPTPRLNSAEALPMILLREPNDGNLAKVIEGITHSNAIIRLNTSRHLQKIIEKNENKLFPILLERIKIEKDALVGSSFLTALSQISYDETKATQIMDAAYSNSVLFTWNNNFVDNFSFIVSWYAISKRNKKANNLLLNAVEREEFAHSVIFRSYNDFRFLIVRKGENDDFYMKSVIQWTLNYIDKYGDELRAVSADSFNQDNPIVKKTLSFYDFIIQRIFFVFDSSPHGNRPTMPVPNEDLQTLYFHVKPILEKVQLVSSQTSVGGLVTGHTAHYFIQLLNLVLQFDPKSVLEMATQITLMASKTGYTFDSMAIQQVVNLTEKLLADHRQLIADDQGSFDNLVNLLDLYINSGWIDALELLWKLDEIFK